jgi:hypothetical protein
MATLYKSPPPQYNRDNNLNGNTNENTGCTFSQEYWLHFFHLKNNDFNIVGLAHSADSKKVQPVKKCSQLKKNCLHQCLVEWLGLECRGFNWGFTIWILYFNFHYLVKLQLPYLLSPFVHLIVNKGNSNSISVQYFCIF